MAVYAGIGGPLSDDEPDRTFVVADADTGDRLLDIPVDDGEEITLTYTHSVEKTTVEEIYVVDGTELHNDRMVFSSYGAGLPSEAEVEETDEGLVTSVDRTYDELHVSPGSIAGHELIVGGDRYDLVERSNGSRVVLFVDEGSTETDTLGHKYVNRGVSESALSHPQTVVLAADRLQGHDREYESPLLETAAPIYSIVT